MPHQTWEEYDIYTVDEDGAFEPFTGTFMAADEAQQELQRLRATHPDLKLVLVKGSFQIQE